jgi:hypothetical protein
MFCKYAAAGLFFSFCSLLLGLIFLLLKSWLWVERFLTLRMIHSLNLSPLGVWNFFSAFRGLFSFFNHQRAETRSLGSGGGGRVKCLGARGGWFFGL